MLGSITFSAILQLVGYFTFLYPLTMSMVWVIGGLYFWWRRERRGQRNNWPDIWPSVTILVPCHNEAVSIEATCQALSNLEYPDYRVVFIDDASTDNTAELIRRWTRLYSNFHLLRLKTNQGKALALNWALSRAVNTPLVVIIDADTLVTPQAIKWLAAPFTYQPRLGAVSGNPLVYNRTSLLENVQSAEFASILSLIKRSQRSLGRILTVSGCITAFRTDILRKVGGFSTRTATEDIDVTWAVQRYFQEVWFEPRAVAFIQVPSRLKDFWRQRCRWALGGWHLLRTHGDIFLKWRWRRLWPVYFDFLISYVWSFCFVGGTLLWIISGLLSSPPLGFNLFPAWYGAVISFACLVQFGAALLANSPYDKKLWKSFFWVPWYPIFFFSIGALTVVSMAYSGIFGSLERAGQWKSPTRSSAMPLEPGPALQNSQV